MSYQDLIEQLKGGAGSGNFGHSGIPGKVGGSAPGSGITIRLTPKEAKAHREGPQTSLEQSQAEVYRGKIIRLAGQEVTVHTGQSNVPRKGVIMRSGLDGFKLIGRPTTYTFDDVKSVIGNTIRMN